MYTIKKTFKFEAAHYLPNHDGKCANRHGHGYKMIVILKGASLSIDGPKKGMLLDYHDLSSLVNPLIEKLDHHDLNEIIAYPTAENLAKWTHQQLLSEMMKTNYYLKILSLGVSIKETDDTEATYEGDVIL